jgi:hypothetical protein
MILFYLSWLVYGGDVSGLSNREYAVREASQNRLERAGWLAAPAVWRGLLSPCPECAARSERIDGRLHRWPERLAESLLDARHTPPEPIMEVSPAMARLVCRVIDRRGGWDYADSYDWVLRTPYRTGTVAGDFALVVQTARSK